MARVVREPEHEMRDGKKERERERRESVRALRGRAVSANEEVSVKGESGVI